VGQNGILSYSPIVHWKQPATYMVNQPKAGNVQVEIYNVLGEKIVTLLDRHLAAGLNSVQWNSIDESGKAVGSGLYFYRVAFDNQQAVTWQILLLK